MVARLVAGSSPLTPQVDMLADAHVKTDILKQRLDIWMTARITARLGPLLALRDAADAKTGTAGALPGEARGIAHQLAENFAALERAALKEQLPEKTGAADPRPAPLRRLVRTAQRLPAQAAAPRCSGAADPAVGCVDQNRKRRLPRPRPVSHPSLWTRVMTQRRFMLPASPCSAAAPSILYCLSKPPAAARVVASAQNKTAGGGESDDTWAAHLAVSFST